MITFAAFEIKLHGYIYVGCSSDKKSAQYEKIPETAAQQEVDDSTGRVTYQE